MFPSTVALRVKTKHISEKKKVFYEMSCFLKYCCVRFCYKLCKEIVGKPVDYSTVILCHGSFLPLAISAVSLWQIVIVTCFWQHRLTQFPLPDDPCQILFLSTERLRQHTSPKKCIRSSRGVGMLQCTLQLFRQWQILHTTGSICQECLPSLQWWWG